MKKLFFLLTAILGLLLGLRGQTESSWKYFKAPLNSKALLSDDIRDITFGTDGDLWCSTWGGGLSHLNGNDWQTYTKTNFPFSVNDISAVVIDNQGAKWIATYGGGIIRFAESVTSYNINSNGAFLSNHINSATKDLGGNLWFGTVGGGVLKWNGTEFTTIDKNNSGLQTNDIHKIMVDHAGNIWFATFGGGLSKYDGNTWVTYSTANSSLKSNYISDLAEDQDGNIWLATDTDGLCKFLVDTQVFDYSSFGHSVVFADVQTVSVDAYNNVWAGGSKSGLYRYSSGIWSFFDVHNSGLPSNTVNKIAFDQDGVIWIGTAAGLCRFDDNGWVVYNKENTHGPGPQSNYLVKNFIDHKGHHWMITSPSGISKYDGQTWTHYNHETSSLPLTPFTCITEDLQGNIWVGTPEHGAYKFDGNTWTGYSTGNSQIADNNVTSMACDQQGNLWVGSIQNGLSKFDGQNWSVIPPFSNGFNARMIQCLVADNQDNLWIGTIDEGLFKFHGNTFTQFVPDMAQASSKSILAMAIGVSGDLWLGSPNGLMHFDGEHWQVYNISNSSLIDQSINSVSVDHEGNVWAATQGGLSVFNGSQWASFVAGPNGLPINLIGSVQVDDQNNKWIATNGGGLCELLSGEIEFQEQRKWYVHENAPGDGTSWAEASGDLALIIENAHPGDSIFVATGTYRPVEGSYFVMKPGVKIFGGFLGTEYSFLNRDLKAGFESVLMGNGSGIIVNDNNGVTSSAVLDGFTLTGGTGYDISNLVRGGAMFNNNVSLAVANCIFKNNIAEAGGAVYTQMGGVSFKNCRFISNKVQSVYNGGAVYDDRSSSNYINCVFTDNQAGNVTGESGAGGAVALLSAYSSFYNCLFDHNRSLGKNDGGGGAIFMDQSFTNINNCTFYGNTSTALFNTRVPQGNALSIDAYGTPGSHVRILNSIIYGAEVNQVAKLSPNSLTVDHSVIKGYGEDVNGDGVIDDKDVVDNIGFNTNPLFMDEQVGDYTLKPTSPCISAGMLSSIYPTDLAGNPRVRDGKIDLGAYQSRGLEFHGEPGQQLTSNRSDTTTDGMIYLYNDAENSVIVGVDPDGQDLGDIKATGTLSANYGSGAPTVLESPFGVSGEVFCLNRSWHVELTRPDFNRPVAVRFFIDTADLRDLITKMPTNTLLPRSLEEWKAFAPLIRVYKVAGDDAYAADATNYKQYTYSEDNETADLSHFIIGRYQQLFYLEFMVGEFSSGSVAYMPLATPIQLLDFKGTLRNGQAEFSWQTGEESNFEGFDLEKSVDNLHYSSVASIKPKGNNSSYRYALSQVELSAFYRLRMLDQDGRSEYSRVVNLEQKKGAMVVYPNPAKDFIYVRTEQAGTAYFYDQSGRLVLSRPVEKGQSQIDIGTLAAGVYYIRVVDQRIKFVKR